MIVQREVDTIKGGWPYGNNSCRDPDLLSIFEQFCHVPQLVKVSIPTHLPT